MLDLGSEVQWFNTHWGNILLLEFFCFHRVKPILALLPISFNDEKSLLRLRLTDLKILVVNTRQNGSVRRLLDPEC